MAVKVTARKVAVKVTTKVDNKLEITSGRKRWFDIKVDNIVPGKV